MEVVKKYKVILDERNVDNDKQITITFNNSGDMFGRDDLIDQRAEDEVNKIFKEEYPTIDFEKYCFKPDSSLSNLSLYFYRILKTTQEPVTYDDYMDPRWVYNDQNYILNNRFTTTDVSSWRSSYFKFDFFSSIVGEQKILFSIALPVNGTMLIDGQIPLPQINFNGSVKTEINDIFWLRRPEQLPGMNFSGNTITLYCTVNFHNNLIGKIQRFKTIPSGVNSNSYLPTTTLTKTTFTERYYFLKYVLDYSTLTYKIKRFDNSEFTNGIINLYSN